MSHKVFYTYKNLYWVSINKDQLIRITIRFLKSQYPNIYKKFNLNSLDNFCLLIYHLKQFSMPEAINIVNKDGFLLPFFNGVLNVKTKNFMEHSPDFI